MKNLLFISLIFITFKAHALEEIFYCSMIDNIGFEGDTNYKSHENYKLKEAVVTLDFRNQTILSEGFGFSDATCVFDYNIITCMELGYLFTMNPDNYKFTLSHGFGYALGIKDDILISYGNCEKF